MIFLHRFVLFFALRIRAPTRQNKTNTRDSRPVLVPPPISETVVVVLFFNRSVLLIHLLLARRNHSRSRAVDEKMGQKFKLIITIIIKRTTLGQRPRVRTKGEGEEDRLKCSTKWLKCEMIKIRSDEPRPSNVWREQVKIEESTRVERKSLSSRARLYCCGQLFVTFNLFPPSFPLLWSAVNRSFLSCGFFGRSRSLWEYTRVDCVYSIQLEPKIGFVFLGIVDKRLLKNWWLKYLTT